MESSNNRNLILAIVLSAAVLFGWQYFVAGPQMKAEQQKQALLVKQKSEEEAKPAALQVKPAETGAIISRGQALKQVGARVPILTPTVDGSLSLMGARFDDLQLRRYRETVDPKSPEIVLLSPKNTAYPYYAMFGFVAAPGDDVKLPGDSTPWTLAGGKVLAPNHPITLRWDNGEGLVFTRTIAVDDQYMFTVSDAVANKSAKPHTLYPYAYVARDGVPQGTHYWALHEGFVGVADGSLKDAKYGDFDKGEPPQNFQSTGGWLGITDKYWMAAVVPPQNEAFDGNYRGTPYRETKAYQADYRLNARTLAPGGTLNLSQHLFAGAKVVSMLQDYESNLGIQKFDYAIDWGWYSFFTRPMFWVLDKSYQFLGNFGLAILVLTVVIRLALYPLANAGFRQMTRMKKLQPEMERIKERFADDRVKQQQEMMALYQREKVNPVSGCLPQLIQIPILFSLYKVFLVTIEMYHAPFFGWIRDLSAPDPTSLLNLFGLLPYNPHAVLPSFLLFLSIGIWPILLGATQWVQTKMNPAPADPVQAQMFSYMPLIFMFMFASLPSGLVIYYTWSNFLTLLQQWLMMTRHGVEIHLFQNLKLPAALKRLTKPGASAAGE